MLWVVTPTLVLSSPLAFALVTTLRLAGAAVVVAPSLPDCGVIPVWGTETTLAGTETRISGAAVVAFDSMPTGPTATAVPLRVDGGVGNAGWKIRERASSTSYR